MSTTIDQAETTTIPTGPGATSTPIALQTAIASEIQGGIKDAAALQQEEASSIIAGIPRRVKEVVQAVIQQTSSSSPSRYRDLGITINTRKASFAPGSSWEALHPVDRMVWDLLRQAGFKMSLYELGSWYGTGYELRVHVQISKELVDAVEREQPTLNVAVLLGGAQAR